MWLKLLVSKSFRTRSIIVTDLKKQNSTKYMLNLEKLIVNNS